MLHNAQLHGINIRGLRFNDFTKLVSDIRWNGSTDWCVHIVPLDWHYSTENIVDMVVHWHWRQSNVLGQLWISSSFWSRSWPTFLVSRNELFWRTVFRSSWNSSVTSDYCKWFNTRAGILWPCFKHSIWINSMLFFSLKLLAWVYAFQLNGFYHLYSYNSLRMSPTSLEFILGCLHLQLAALLDPFLLVFLYRRRCKLFPMNLDHCWTISAIINIKQQMGIVFKWNEPSFRYLINHYWK